MNIQRFPQSPQFAGLKALAVFDPQAVPEASRILAAHGFRTTMPENIVWLNTDDIPQIKYSSEFKDNAASVQTVLKFTTRDNIPARHAFIAVAADDTVWAIGLQLYHQGVLKSSASTSDPKGDPVTVTYEFTSPYPPLPVNT